MMNEDVRLWCRNCAALHSLNDNAKNITKKDE